MGQSYMGLGLSSSKTQEDGIPGELRPAPALPGYSIVGSIVQSLPASGSRAPRCVVETVDVLRFFSYYFVSMCDVQREKVQGR